MKKIYLLLTFFVFSQADLIAQDYVYINSEEYLNANAFRVSGLDFAVYFNKENNRNPEIRPAMFHNGKHPEMQGGAAVSHHKTGELLFYTEGDKLRNKNHGVLLNSAGLKPETSSTFLGSRITPFIGNLDKYMVFSLQEEPGSSKRGKRADSQLSYTIVDMTLDGGLGGVDLNQKNVFIDSFFEKQEIRLGETFLTIPGDNKDIWLIVHSWKYLMNDTFSNPAWENHFFVLHVKEGGKVEQMPVSWCKSNLLNFIDSVRPGNNPYLSVSVSSDRKTIALGPWRQPAMEMLEFDPTNGAIGSKVFVNLDTAENASSDGIAISSNGRYVYRKGVGRDYNALFGIGMGVLQYDLSSNDAATIARSGEFVYRWPINTLEDYFRYYLFTNYNNNIYLLGYDVMNSVAIGVLENSDEEFSKVIMRDSLSYADTLVANEPNFSAEVVYPISRRISSHIVNCEFVEISAQDNGDASNYVWDDGGTGRTRNITALGTYWVHYTKMNQDHCLEWSTDTIHVIEYLSEAPVIAVSTSILSVPNIYASYQWFKDGSPLSGETTYMLDAAKYGNGEYKIDITDENGCKATSDPYRINNQTSITSVSVNTLKVYPNPTTGVVNIDESVNVEVFDMTFKLLETIKNTNAVNLGVYANGLYWLKIHPIDGGNPQMVKVSKKD